MDQLTVSTPSICEVLNAKIRKYKREHPRLNSSQIARRFGISSSTFNRIENNDIRNPSIEQVSRIMQGTGSHNELNEFMRKYYPEIHTGLLKSFIESTKDRNLCEEQDMYFSDESTYKLMMYASTVGGLDEQHILDEYGRSGHERFMKLAAKGVLKNRNGKFYFSEGKTTWLTGISTIKVTEYALKEAAETMRLNGELKGTNVKTVFEQVELKKISKELQDLTSDYYGKVKQILDDPENAGNDLVQISTLLKRF